MVNIMPIIIHPEFNHPEMIQLIHQYAEENGLNSELYQQLSERVKRMSDAFCGIFDPYFKSESNERYEAICENINAFVRRLRISVRGNKDKAIKRELGRFWKKAGRTIQKDAEASGDRYLYNSCRVLTHAIETLFAET